MIPENFDIKTNYKVKTFANLLGVSEKTVYNWVYSGRISAIKIGESLRIPQSELGKIIVTYDRPCGGDSNVR